MQATDGLVAASNLKGPIPMSNLLFFIAIVISMTGQFEDVHTTDAGLAAGMVEMGLKIFGHSLPNIGAWLVKKLGISPLYAVKTAGIGLGIPMALAFAINSDLRYSVAAAFLIGAVGWAAAIRNVYELRKAGKAKSILSVLF